MKKRILILAMSLLIGGCAGNNNPSADINTTNSSITSTTPNVTTGKATTSNVPTSTITPSTPTPTTPTPSTPTTSTANPSTPTPTTSNGSCSSSSTIEIENPNEVKKVKGNGESYPEKINNLIIKVLSYDKNYESIPVIFINAEYYSAYYYEADENTDSKISKNTTVICENSTSFSTTESNEIMTSYTASLKEAGFEIDKSDFAKYGVYSATRKIKLNAYFVIEYGLKELSYDETTYESFNAFVLYYAYIKTLATNGWSGVDITEWPTEDIAELTGTDIPHPDLNYNTISLFGGFNTLIITAEDTGKNSYLDCYILLLTGSVRTDEDAYIQQLEDAYWQVATYEKDTDGNSNGGYAFNMLSQVVVKFFYMTQTGYEGLCLFIYVNNPSFVFTKSEAWPEVANCLPAYTQEEATLSYYFAHIENEQIGIVVGGVLNNADELYAKQLTSAGWTVTKEIDSDNNNEYYLASHESYGTYKFYMSSYPETGISLYIESIN